MTNKALSPLRYPGGKTRVASQLVDYVLQNNPTSYASPFGGGGAVLLEVATRDPKISLHYNDKDARIAALYYVVSADSPRMFNRLVSLVEDTVPSIELFDAMSSENYSPSPRGFASRGKVDLAYAALIRNRLSFSGILDGTGPAGGRSGAGDIGARWYGATLVRRLHHMRDLLKGRTTVTTLDFSEVPYAEAMIIDPPYVRKAHKLYAHWFAVDDHRRLADYVMQAPNTSTWIVTYDNDPLIQRLYPNHLQDSQDMTYSIAQGGGSGKVEATELWVTSQ